jgi:phosphatidylglycerophosphate synthase
MCNPDNNKNIFPHTHDYIEQNSGQPADQDRLLEVVRIHQDNNELPSSISDENTEKRILDRTHQYVPKEGLTEKEQRQREKRGRRYRLAADSVMYGRTAIGALVGFGILAGASILPKPVQYRSIGLAMIVTGLGAADKGDGMLARRSAKNGVPITDHDKQKDPYHDKLFFHMLLGSIATRELLDQNYVYGSVLLASQAVTAVRDRKMTQSRNLAPEGAEIAALPINKIKTGLQSVAHVGATSPIANTGIGQVLVASTYVATNVMGIIGYRQAHEQHTNI